MFTDFFYMLRRQGIPVSVTEWMAFIEALAKGLHGSSLMGFYELARMLLVKDESYFDDFDRVFVHYFEGLEIPAGLRKNIEEWLKNPIAGVQLTDEEKRLLDTLSSEELRRLFEKRLAEQSERHDGGGKWIGTGGTSPFGHGGYNPAGIRVGGESRHNRAIQVASERRFRAHRHDLILDTRQISLALKKLRVLARQGRPDELDLDETIDETSRDAGELHIVFRPARKNRVKVLLLMDVGGTMNPHTRTVSRLFTAAHRASHFKDFKYFFFHNCIYETLYDDVAMWKGRPTAEVFNELGESYRTIIVGDAYMYPGELTDPWGASYYYHRNDIPGIEWLRRVRDHFDYSVWLNPRPEYTWRNPSAQMIRMLFPMYEMSLDGLESAIRVLTGAEKVRLPRDAA